MNSAPNMLSTSLESLHTPLEEAAAELHRRRADRVLLLPLACPPTAQALRGKPLAHPASHAPKPPCLFLFGGGFSKQIVPRTAHRGLQAGKRRDEDIETTRFDLLAGAGVEVGQFGKLFLSQSAGCARPAQVRAEHFEKSQKRRFLGHALLRRVSPLTNTAQWGVNFGP